MGFTNSVVGGQGALVRPAIKSPNFVHDVSGWSIDKNGNAEFNGLSLNGTFSGTDYVINSAGAFFYSGTPASGNLIASIASSGGTDAFGNVYFGGMSVYDSSGNVVEMAAGTVFLFNRISGAFFATLSPAGMLIYNGPPASGNLIASVASSAGTDSHGNAIAGGIAVYDYTVNDIQAQLEAGVLALQPTAGGQGAGIQWNPSSLLSRSGSVLSSSATDPSTLQAFIDIIAPTGSRLNAQVNVFGWEPTGAVILPAVINVAGGPVAGGPGVAASYGADSTGYPFITDAAGLGQQISGSKLANPAGSGPYPVTVPGTAIASLGFLAVPPGDVEAGTTYEVHAAGFFSTGATVPTSATLSIHWGGVAGTTLASLQIPGTIAASQSLAGWFAEAEIYWASTSEAVCTLMVGWHTATGVVGSAQYFVVGDVTGLVTNSGSKNLALGFQWGSTPTGTSFTCNAFRAGRLA